MCNPLHRAESRSTSRTLVLPVHHTAKFTHGSRQQLAFTGTFRTLNLLWFQWVASDIFNSSLAGSPLWLTTESGMGMRLPYGLSDGPLCLDQRMVDLKQALIPTL